MRYNYLPIPISPNSIAIETTNKSIVTIYNAIFDRVNFKRLATCLQFNFPTKTGKPQQKKALVS